MKPSVGRIVHYIPHVTWTGRDECMAAIVTWIDPDRSDGIQLAVLAPTGLYFNWSTHNEDSRPAGTWHWPEREDE